MAIKYVHTRNETYYNFGINRILLQHDCYEPEVISAIRSAFDTTWFRTNGHNSLAFRHMKRVPVLSESAERVEMVEMIESLFEAIVDQQDEPYVDAGAIFARLPLTECGRLCNNGI